MRSVQELFLSSPCLPGQADKGSSEAERIRSIWTEFLGTDGYSVMLIYSDTPAFPLWHIACTQQEMY